MSFFELVLGKPLATSEERAECVGPIPGIAVFGLDALSSAAYGPEAALTLLIPLGLLGIHYIVPVSFANIALLTIVYFSYRQTIDAYPHGGGSYTVASENLGEVAGLFAAGRTHPVSGAHAPGAPDRRPGSRAGREGLDTGAAAQSARAVVEADASAARQPAHHGHQYTVVFLSRKLNGTVLAG